MLKNEVYKYILCMSLSTMAVVIIENHGDFFKNTPDAWWNVDAQCVGNKHKDLWTTKSEATLFLIFKCCTTNCIYMLR